MTDEAWYIVVMNANSDNPEVCCRGGRTMFRLLDAMAVRDELEAANGCDYSVYPVEGL